MSRFKHSFNKVEEYQLSCTACYTEELLCGGSFCFMSWCLNFFVLLAPYVCFHILVKVTEWPPIGKIAAHSAYDMFHGIST